MVNSCYSYVNEWIFVQGSNAYIIAREGILSGAIHTVMAAVSLPLRILGYCNNGNYDNYDVRKSLRESGGKIADYTVQSLLNVVNPYAQIHVINPLGDKALCFFDEKMDGFAQSTYSFNRQVTTRLCYALKVPAAAAARAFDAVISAVALTFALVLLGINDDLNTVASLYAGSAGQIVGDLFECILGFCNPAAFYE